MVIRRKFLIIQISIFNKNLNLTILPAQGQLLSIPWYINVHICIYKDGVLPFILLGTCLFHPKTIVTNFQINKYTVMKHFKMLYASVVWAYNNVFNQHLTFKYLGYFQFCYYNEWDNVSQKEYADWSISSIEKIHITATTQCLLLVVGYK